MKTKIIVLFSYNNNNSILVINLTLLFLLIYIVSFTNIELQVVLWIVWVCLSQLDCFGHVCCNRCCNHINFNTVKLTLQFLDRQNFTNSISDTYIAYWQRWYQCHYNCTRTQVCINSSDIHWSIEIARISGLHSDRYDMSVGSLMLRRCSQ